MSLTVYAAGLIASLGYGGLALGLVVDSAGVPIPSEVLLPLAGALARQGRFDLLVVIVIGTLAQTVGAVISYWVGATGGLPLVKRYGKYVLFREHELAKTQTLFAKWGGWLTFFGRMMPGIRTYIGYPAGLAKMSFGRFFAASLIGSFGWTVFLAILGYKLSNNLATIDYLIARFGLIALGLTVILLILYLLRNSRTKTAV